MADLRTMGISTALIVAAAACSAEEGDSGRPMSYGGASGRGVGGLGATAGTGSSGTSGASGLGGSGAVPGVGGVGAVGGVGGTGNAGTAGSGGTSGSGATDASGGTTGSGGSSGAAGSAGSAPAGTLLFEDFEDGKADGWIADADDGNDKFGDWAVVTEGASKVYKEQKEYSDPSFAVGGDLAWTDQALETKVQFVSSAAGDAIAYLAVRFSTEKRYYFLEFAANESNGSLKVRKRLDGSTTDLISSYKTGMPVGPGTWYTLGLSAVGTTITASLNGKVIGTATDGDLKNGGIAVGIRDAVAIFDDVKVTKP